MLIKDLIFVFCIMLKYMKVVQVAQPSCILLFDGASKGNPGQAGAGAVLRAEDGSMVCS